MTPRNSRRRRARVVSAFVLVLALRANASLGTDHVDGRPGEYGDEARYGPDAWRDVVDPDDSEGRG